MSPTQDMELLLCATILATFNSLCFPCFLPPSMPPAPPKIPRPLPNLPQGSEPLFVCATSGTTVLGAFDPLDAIADICARHGLWLHVDVSLGSPWLGGTRVSPCGH